MASFNQSPTHPELLSDLLLNQGGDEFSCHLASIRTCQQPLESEIGKRAL
jgi:hypothetical protein